MVGRCARPVASFERVDEHDEARDGPLVEHDALARALDETQTFTKSKWKAIGAHRLALARTRVVRSHGGVHYRPTAPIAKSKAPLKGAAARRADAHAPVRGVKDLRAICDAATNKRRIKDSGMSALGALHDSALEALAAQVASVVHELDPKCASVGSKHVYAALAHVVADEGLCSLAIDQARAAIESIRLARRKPAASAPAADDGVPAAA
jgi:hypothetical protein